MDIKKLEGIVVFILESLHEEDMHTGSNLCDVIRQYQYDITDISLEYKYYNIDSKLTFHNTLLEIKKRTDTGNFCPIIQLECHGFKDGIELTSSEQLKWSEVFDYIRPINIASSNLLLLNLSMCNGDAVIRYIDPRKRAPFRAVIGPAGDVYPENLQNMWSDFYQLYLKSLCEGNRETICSMAISSGLIYYSQEFIFDVHYDTQNLYPNLFEEWMNNNLAKMIKKEGPLLIKFSIYKKWMANKK